MRPATLTCLLLCAALLLAAGCTRSLRYYTNVDSIAVSDQSIGRRYLLLPGNQGTTPDDLEFLEYARYVDTALAPLGFLKATSEQEADIAIFVSYGVSAPDASGLLFYPGLWSNRRLLRHDHGNDYANGWRHGQLLRQHNLHAPVWSHGLSDRTTFVHDLHPLVADHCL